MKLLAALILLASPALADQIDRVMPQPIPGDFVIAQPGSYYLTGNRLGPGFEPLIRINADNVTLDLRGFVVRCEPPNPGTAITHGILALNRSNITIRNGIITGCWVGSSAGGTHNLRIEGIDYSRNTYLGHTGAGSYAVFRNNIFAQIEGYSVEPYAVGLNAPGNGCLIEHNVFRNLHRQPTYVGPAGGEGVGILHEAGSGGCLDRFNWFENDQIGNLGLHRNIAIWIGSGAQATVKRNTVIDYPRPVFSYTAGNGTFLVYNNVIRLRQAVADSIAIAAQNGEAKDNFVQGYITPLFGGIVDNGGNAFLP